MKSAGIQKVLSNLRKGGVVGDQIVETLRERRKSIPINVIQSLSDAKFGSQRKNGPRQVREK